MTPPPPYFPAPALSADATVLGDDCTDAEDLDEWRGLVHFGSTESRADAFEQLWQRRRELKGARRSFAERFAPDLVLRRAGIHELVAQQGKRWIVPSGRSGI